MRRSRLARDVIVFQGKLLLDAFKDVLLGPFSLIAALVDLTRPGPRSRSLFYRLLRHGKSAERAIDLFSAVERRSDDDRWTVDAVIAQVETRLAGGEASSRSAPTGDREEAVRPGSVKTPGDQE